MERQVPLSDEDILDLGKTAGQYRNLALFFSLPLLLGIIGYFVMSSSTFFLVISIIGLLLSVMCFFIAIKLQKEVKSGVKFIIEGILQSKRIHKSGSTISFKLIGDGNVSVDEQTPSGHINSVEPIDWPVGKKDLRFYYFEIGGKEYKVSRTEFFKFELENKLAIERLPAGKVIRVRKL